RRWDLLRGANSFVMFREPVDQCISQYFDLVRKREFVEPTYIRNDTRFPESLEEFIENPLHCNNQLAFMLGNYQLTTKRSPDQADLELAKEILLDLKVSIGLIERYAESLGVFGTVTGQKIPEGKVELRNQNPDRPPIESIDDRVRDVVRERSALDIQLYG